MGNYRSPSRLPKSPQTSESKARWAQGLVAGAVLTVVGQPFDTYKTRLQQKPSFTGPMFKHMYRGAAFPFVGSIATNGIFFSVFYTCKNEYGINPLLCGGLAGALASPVTTLFGSGKVWRQVNGKKAGWPPSRPSYWGRSLFATAARDIPAMAGYFVTLEAVNTMVDSRCSIPVVPSLIAGGAAGIVSWSVSYPADTVASRLYSVQHLTISSAIQEGMLWRGFQVCLIRAVLVNALTFSISDWVYRNWICQIDVD